MMPKYFPDLEPCVRDLLYKYGLADHTSYLSRCLRALECAGIEANDFAETVRKLQNIFPADPPTPGEIARKLELSARRMDALRAHSGIWAAMHLGSGPPTYSIMSRGGPSHTYSSIDRLADALIESHQ